jgi:hypothetical protein
MITWGINYRAMSEGELRDAMLHNASGYQVACVDNWCVSVSMRQQEFPELVKTVKNPFVGGVFDRFHGRTSLPQIKVLVAGGIAFSPYARCPKEMYFKMDD